LLTDSELLKKSLSPFFRLPVAVVPVPHTYSKSTQFRPKPSKEIICWWAGPPREEKGWRVIRNIMSLTVAGANDILLVAAKSSGLVARPDGVKLALIDDALSPSEYARWLFEADILLLPYNSNFYREETSGIFVEAIVAGKFPLVSQDTWMAFELQKSGLEELIMDWHNPGLITLITEIPKRNDLRRKIDLMRDKYSAYHNEAVYASTMAGLYEYMNTLPQDQLSTTS
jgi:hypothetical protein